MKCGARNAYAARFNFDLRAISRDLKEQEKRSGRKPVSYALDGTDAANQTPQPTEAATPVSKVSKS